MSTAIDRYIYCTVKKHSTSFLENFRLNYSDTELVSDLDSIRNEIIRESLIRHQLESAKLSRLYIGTIGDTRSNSGLGSSSAFACALDLALLNLQAPSQVLAEDIANRACNLEVNILKKPIGIQDQWATAFGGFNSYNISPNGIVEVNQVLLSDEQMNVLRNCMILVDTGISRNSESITHSYSKPDGRQEENLKEMHSLAKEIALELPNKSAEELPSFLGNNLNKTWRLKRELHSTVATKQIDKIYDQLISFGCLGGKLLGAGGGGYILMITHPAELEKITTRISLEGMLFDTPRPTTSGTEVLVRC